MTPRRVVPRVDRLVVGIDFSSDSVAAATWVAQRFAPGAELILVHVIQLPPVPRFLEKRFPATEDILATARTGAEIQLRELSASIATGLIWLEVRIGSPDEELVRVAEDFDADLLVVGQPEPRPDGWGRIGTTAQRVLRRSQIPVLLVAGEPTSAPSRILVAVDDSDMTDPVLSWGAALSKRYSADARALHVVSVPLFIGGSALANGLAADCDSAGPLLSPQERATEDAERWLKGRLKRFTHDSPMTALIAAGHVRPADAIIALAKEETRTLVVMGSRGGGMAHRFLYGSVAEGVLRAAPCPVLVVVPRRGRSRRSPRVGTNPSSAITF